VNGGEGVNQSPLKEKAFSIFPDQNPPFEKSKSRLRAPGWRIFSMTL
jgi:hypothetical protein